MKTKLPLSEPRICFRSSFGDIKQVLEIDQKEVKVIFLRDRGGYYTYPAVPDESWVDIDQIIRVMDHPAITIREQYIFQ